MKNSLFRTTAGGIILMLVLYAGAQGREARKFGIGLMLGTPEGISFKYWLNGVNALTGGISLGDESTIQLNYLWHDFNTIRAVAGKLPIHYGFGANIHSAGNGGTLAVRGVIGLTYILSRTPVDMFFEFAPLWKLTADSVIQLTASVGARYYFGKP
jgi:hypothetical protein